MLSEIIKEVILPPILAVLTLIILMTSALFILDFTLRSEMIKQCEQKTNKQCKIIEEVIPE